MIVVEYRFEALLFEGLRLPINTLMSDRFLYHIYYTCLGAQRQVLAREMDTRNMLGFLSLSGIVQPKPGIIISVADERIRTELAGVDRMMIPIHSVIRVDRIVESRPSNAQEGASVNVTPLRR